MTLVRGLPLLLNLFFLPLTIRNLGIEQYGVIAAILAIVNIFLVIDLGATNSLLTRFSREFNNRESKIANILFTNSIILLLGWSMFLFTIFFLIFRSTLSNKLPGFITELELQGFNGVILFFLLSLNMISNIAGRLLFGMGLENRAYVVSLSINSLTPAAMYLASFNGSMMLMVSIQMLCSIIIGGGTLGYIVFISKEIKFEIHTLHGRHLLELLRSGSLYQYLQLFAVINAQLFPLYALFAFGEGQAGVLVAILKVCSFPVALIGLATLPLWVSASKEVHRGNTSLLSLFRNQFAEAVVISIVFALLFVAIGQQVMQFVIGEQSTDIETKLILSASVFVIVLGAIQPLANILHGARINRFLYVVNPLLLLFSLICMTLFTRIFAESAMFLGLAAANLFVYLIPGLVYLHRVSQKLT